MYWALRDWLLEQAARWGLEVELVDTTDLDALAAALRPGRTRLVWLETPANPTWEISDIAAAAEIAHRAGARLAVDSTVATPVLTRPLALGADLVMHSATKYLNGHSDVIAGTLTTAPQDEPGGRGSRPCARRQGGILGSFEAWLLLRGMRTLYLRVRQSCRCGASTSPSTSPDTPRVAEVLYPGLPASRATPWPPARCRAASAACCRSGCAAARRPPSRPPHGSRFWKRATSLGGVESLIEHRASIEGPASPVPPDLLRLSVGIEEPDDLIADLEAALAG